MRRAAGQIGGLVVAVGLLVAFFWFYDVGSALGTIVQASVPLMLLSVAFQVVHLFIRALRWRLLLAPIKTGISFHNLFSTIVIGYMATTIFPFRVGEVIRPLMLAGRERISKGATLATVGVERVLDFLMVVGFFAAYLLLFVDELQAGALGSESWTRMIAGARVAGAALLLALPLLFLFARYGEVWTRRVAGRLGVDRSSRGGRLLAAVETFAGGMRALTDPGLLLRSLTTSLATWLAIAAATWFGVRAMGVDYAFPPQASLLLVPFLAVGVSTPSPGGAGGYHIICSLALEQLFGAPSSAAAATAIVLWFLAWGPMALLGFFYLWRAGLSLHHLKEMARPTASPPAPAGAVREGDPT